MIRGQLSNERVKMHLVDVRLLLKIEKSEKFYLKRLPDELDISYEVQVRHLFPFIRGAKRFLSLNENNRIAHFTIGYSGIVRALCCVLGDYLVESYDFENRDDFRMWYRGRKDIANIYSSDKNLVSLDSRFKLV